MAVRPAVAPGSVLREHTRRFTLAQALVHGFYAFLLYLAIAQMTEIPIYAELSTFHPLWPVAMAPAPRPDGGRARAVLLFPRYEPPGRRAARLANGPRAGVRGPARIRRAQKLLRQDRPQHAPAAARLAAAGRVAARLGTPRARTGRALRQSTLLVFWMCGAAVLLTYTMSGIGKLGGALYQLARLEPNAFAPGGLGAHIAQRLLQTDSHSLLGAWIIEHPWLTWPAMPTAVYLETVFTRDRVPARARRGPGRCCWSFSTWGTTSR